MVKLTAITQNRCSFDCPLIFFNLELPVLVIFTNPMPHTTLPRKDKQQNQSIVDNKKGLYMNDV